MTKSNLLKFPDPPPKYLKKLMVARINDLLRKLNDEERKV